MRQQYGDHYYPPPPSHSAARMVESYGVYHAPPPMHCVTYSANHHDSYEDDVDAGFVPRRAQVYRAGVVVNSMGNSSILRTNPTSANVANNQNYSNTHTTVVPQQTNAQTVQPQTQQTAEPEESEDNSAFCCCKSQNDNNKNKSNNSSNHHPNNSAETSSRTPSIIKVWCRPTFLLLLLVLVASVFVLASGILLYFHYVQQRPIVNPPPDPDHYWNFQEHGYEPCDKTYCAFGAQCVHESDGKTTCVCPTFCEPSIDPVCGTDNVTYDNQCLLRIASCKARVHTRVLHNGECVQNDLCKDKICGFGSRCVVSADGRNSSCVCPEKCHNYGDHTTSHPVCGTDGVDYKNKCEMNKAACKSNTNITVKFSGKCDPCSDMSCAEPEICQLDAQRNPVCRCGESCPLEFTPVCGSDGKTYSNECTLRQEACRTRKSLNIIYRGKCSSGINPCSNARCTSGQECSINKYGIAECLCPPECEPIMRPVCSSDGKTFPSECELKRAACLARVSIDVSYTGVCGEKSPCSDHQCQYGATCVERSGAAHCECPVCSSEFDPVCGSDGISYGNECKLRLEACKHRRDITILYGGPCNGCENKKCDFYAQCESDGAAEGKCVCLQHCSETKLNNGTVCGTDGVTYASECELRKSSCNSKQYVLVAYKGNCDLCEGVECKNGGRCEAGVCVCPTNCEDAGDEPVCASNMLTYPNECEMQKSVCNEVGGSNTPPLTVVFFGDCRERFPAIASTTVASTAISSISELATIPPDNSIPNITGNAKEACRDIHCDFEATCELGPDNFPRCTCRFDCASAAMAAPSSSKPVCASDLRIYPSICAMKMEACQRQDELRLRPLELCQGMEVKPCKGEKPVTDPATGRELDCGNGPFRQDCPSGTYCHQTTRFSRCCRKDKNFIEKKSCEETWYGCCPDGKNAAQGPNATGCPVFCGCNKLGAYSEYCDPNTNKCRCRPGVGGDKCDRCEPGFWGLPKISAGFKGCIPCGCSVFGSVRDDCEQMTGRCVCRPGVQGQKCTVCSSHNKVLGPSGCVSADLANVQQASCRDMRCHFGATCVERNGFTLCDCRKEQCPVDAEVEAVCASDGKTYNSPCELNDIACHSQRDIVMVAFGACKDDMFPGTDWPIRRYTPLQFTQPDDTSAPLSKSTRHLLVPDPRFFYGTATNPLTTDIKDTRDLENALAYRPTPATVRVTALLGDLCSKSSDCFILNSYCVAGACSCLPDYFSSNDRQQCLGDSHPTTELRACSSNPCQHFSTCIDLPGTTYTCICTENYTGPSCEDEIVQRQYEVPAFHGRSYAVLKTIDAYNKLIIEIEFKSYSYDGLLLYNAENDDGTGDFVSIALVNGFVEFRYNLGHGAVIMRSHDKIELNTYHKVVCKRYNRDGLLKLDDADDVAAQAQGSTKALDLRTDAFVGFVPTNHTRVYENIGTDKGFEGCIKKFRIGRDDIEIHLHRHEMVLETKGIRDCSEHACQTVPSPCQNNGNCIASDDLFRCDCSSPQFSGKFCEVSDAPCNSNPCVYGARCKAYDEETFICQCKSEKVGEKCEMEFKNDKQVIPEFNGRSFIRFPPLEQGIEKAFSIDVSFMPKAPNGLILYSGQMKNGPGNFVSLSLAHGYLQFQFQLGGGAVDLMSPDPIVIRKWHVARISRKGKEATLQVDNSTIVFGHFDQPIRDHNVDAPLYVGSLPRREDSINNIFSLLGGSTKGFRGIIQALTFNGHPLPITNILPDCSYNPSNNSCASNAGFHEGLPCPLHKNPCLNNGLCVPDLQDFSCQCPPRFKGRLCETEEHVPIRFTGSNHLQYKIKGARNANLTNLENNIVFDLTKGKRATASAEDEEYSEDELERKAEMGNEYELEIQTFSPDGLLLWRTRTRKWAREYFAVAIVDGVPQLSFNLGRDKRFFAVRAQRRVDDGNWHTIHVRRKKRLGIISVDGERPSRGRSGYGAKTLRTTAKMWIGGAPSLPPGLPDAYYKGFFGCVKQLSVHNKPFDLLSNVDGKEVHFCHVNDV